MAKRKILILMGRYLPGYKDGGPLRTIVNVTEALGDEYEFYIATLDRDHGDTVPYPDIRYDCWNQVGKAKVRYVCPGGFSFSLLRRLAKSVDLIYTCGFFCDYGYKSLILNRLGLLYGKPLVVASMGTFSKEALAQKAGKKKLFISLCSSLGLFRNIRWSVTSELEAEDLKREIGSNSSYVVAEDLPRAAVPGSSRDESERLRIVFLSRICRHKNLEMAIDAVAAMENQNVSFSVYGPIQESEYWKHCLEKLQALRCPWTYGGEVPSEDVQQTLEKHDVLVLPTQSENYGHVIFEALSVGCIPVISDRTPWDSVAAQGAGYVLPLEKERFVTALEQLAAMSLQQRRCIAEACVTLAKQKVEESVMETGYRTIFDR